MAKGFIVIDQERCKGCGLCALACPQHVIHLADEALNSKGYHPALFSGDKCTGCAICALMCPDVCITVYREPSKRRLAAQEATSS